MAVGEAPRPFGLRLRFTVECGGRVFYIVNQMGPIGIVKNVSGRKVIGLVKVEIHSVPAIVTQ
jgi:hypothetical protein